MTIWAQVIKTRNIKKNVLLYLIEEVGLPLDQGFSIWVR